MAELYLSGQTLQRGDLEIKFQDAGGDPVNVYQITYALYYVDPNTQAEILIGSATRIPINPQVGEYYAALMIPPSANVGSYRIRWSIMDTAGAALRTVVMQFSVVEKGAQIVTYSSERARLIRRLRILLRDQNPDKFYHFRPPEHEGRIGQFNRVFGQIWEDEELNEYLETALDWWNMMPPRTRELCSLEQLLSTEPAWSAAIIWRAIVHAVFALTLNWISEEFSCRCDTYMRVFLESGEEVDLPIGELYELQEEVLTEG